MGEVLLASKSLLHVDLNHRSWYSIYILDLFSHSHFHSRTLHNTMSQSITVAAYPGRGAGNDPEPFGVVVVACPDQGEGTDPEALGLVINKDLLNLKKSSIMKLL